MCRVVCGKQLPCGKHTCPSFCHNVSQFSSNKCVCSDVFNTLCLFPFLGRMCSLRVCLCLLFLLVALATRNLLLLQGWPFEMDCRVCVARHHFRALSSAELLCLCAHFRVLERGNAVTRVRCLAMNLLVLPGACSYCVSSSI